MSQRSISFNNISVIFFTICPTSSFPYLRKMRSLCLLLLATLSLSSCRTFDLTMLETPKDPINPKLLTLDKRLADFSNATVRTSDAEIKLFTKELEENLFDPYGDKYGYIALKRTVLKKSIGWIWYAPFMASIGFSTLVGIPLDSRKYKVEAEFRIYNRNNRLIGKYSGIGEAKAWIAAYWGYDYSDAETKAFCMALQEAFNEIRPQIQDDAERLNILLMQDGKL